MAYSKIVQELSRMRPEIITGVVLADNRNIPHLPLELQQGVPANVGAAKLSNAQTLTTGQQPTSYPRPTGRARTFEEVLESLFTEDQTKVPSHYSRRDHWLNYYLSTYADRSGFTGKHNGFADQNFRQNRTIQDFYALALGHFDELRNDARINLICHPNNRHRDAALREAIKRNTERGNCFKVENPEKTQTQTETETWAALLAESDVRTRLLNMAKTKPEILTFFLKHTEFKDLKELNEFITQASTAYLDLRIGLSGMETSVRHYIEFLNTLTIHNRLLFLQSCHPLNKFVWDQIPKLELFTVSQAQRILLDLPTESRAVLIKAIRETPEKLLSEYLVESKTPFTLIHFLKLCEKNGITPSDAHFVRVQCDHFSFEDFIAFATPFYHADDAEGINGVLACFFNYFMLHPEELLKKTEEEKETKPTKFFVTRLQQAFKRHATHNTFSLRALYQDNSTFQNIVAFARAIAGSKVTHTADAVYQEFLRSDQDVAPVLRVENAAGETHTVRIDTQESFIVTTTRGGDKTAQLPAQSRDSILTLGYEALSRGDYSTAASSFCLALSIRMDSNLLEATQELITQKKLVKFYPTLANLIYTLLDEINYSLQTGETHQEQVAVAEASIAPSIAAEATMGIVIEDALSKKLTQFSTIVTHLLILSRIQQLQTTRATQCFDRLYQFTLNYRRSALHDTTLFSIWKKLCYLLAPTEQLQALFFCASYLPETQRATEERAIAQAFERLRMIAELPLTHSDTLIETQLVLLLLHYSPSDLQKTVTSSFPTGEKHNVRLFLENLLKTALTLDTLETFAQSILQKIETSIPSLFLPIGQETPYEARMKFERDLQALLLTVFINIVDANNEDAMRVLYQRFYTPTSTISTHVKQTILQKLLATTTNPSVRFILSGKEKELFDHLVGQTHAPLPAPLPTKERACYNGLLQAMADTGNLQGMALLGALGANIEQSTMHTSLLEQCILRANHAGLLANDAASRGITALIDRLSPERKRYLFHSLLSGKNHYQLPNWLFTVLLDHLPECQKTSSITALFNTLIDEQNWDEAETLLNHQANVIKLSHLITQLQTLRTSERNSARINELLAIVENTTAHITPKQAYYCHLMKKQP